MKRSLLVAAVVLSITATSHLAMAEEDRRSVREAADGVGVNLLTAPHTGSLICTLAHGTAVAFLNPANHGPHKFAKVDVLEGDCAGRQGYVPLQSLVEDGSGG